MSPRTRYALLHDAAAGGLFVVADFAKAGDATPEECRVSPTLPAVDVLADYWRLRREEGSA